MNLNQFFGQSATVETYQGAGPTGDLYAAPVTVKGFLDDGVVRVESEHGVSLVSQAKWYCDLSNADLFTPDSRVTVNGVAVYVSKARRRDASSFDGPSHLEVDLR